MFSKLSGLGIVADTGRFTPDEQVVLTRLLLQTNRRDALVVRDLALGLTKAEAAERQGVSVWRVNDAREWDRLLCGLVPTDPRQAVDVDRRAGYIWGLDIPEGLRQKLRQYRTELATINADIDPDRVAIRAELDDGDVDDVPIEIGPDELALMRAELHTQARTRDVPAAGPVVPPCPECHMVHAPGQEECW
jgi:hypothetical protein